MATTFSTLTTRHAEFSLAANVLYQLAETVIQENDPTEAVAIFEDVDRRMRRVLGPAHPQSQSVRRGLEEARAKLLAFHDAADGA